MPDRLSVEGWRRLIPRSAMLGGVLAWLWPIGLGGRMPVGGDATQFSMGLMAFLRASIAAHRLPLWNDLWGFGFPGLAESQMGVFYPPHWLLYGLLPTEAAGVTSLILHTLWGALGANWAARRLGTSEIGSALTGFSWATCGFYLIHLPHLWGATVGSWMPWAWGLSWMIGRGEGSRRTPWLLSAVLALQVLPGHFQLAFVTEVGAVVLAIAAGGRAIGRGVAVVVAVAGMVPLASLQLWPTLRLAQLSDARRDFGYLSGFASSPIHFINYMAPGLFHRSPLWRPVAWDPFHTSPEELLGSIGLVPLFLGWLAISRGWRSDPAVRALVIVGGVMALLSLGPYAPGFEWLIRAPGFSFFRASARWGLGTNLAIALLASRGFDGLSKWANLGRSTRRFSGVCVAMVLVVLLGFELALAASKGSEWKGVASGFDRVLKWLPWADQPESKSFRGVMAEARRPQSDLRTQTSLARLEGRSPTAPGPTLADERFAIYRVELGETAVVLLALAVTGVLARRPRALVASLVALCLAEGLSQARHRPFDLGPALPLIEQSPVLARLARESHGTRTLDPAKNLFMLSGVSPVAAYRTLDLPAPDALLQIARGPLSDPLTSQAVRAAGLGLRVLDPIESRGYRPGENEANPDEVETIRDPALAGWVFGVDLARLSGLQDFLLIRPKGEASRAWLLASKGLKEADGMTDPLTLLEKFRVAIRLPHRSEIPERVEVDVTVVEAVPSMVVLSSTFDPEWRAWWAGNSGERRPAEVMKVLGGWQGVEVPEPGRWTLHLEYPGQASRLGLAVSLVAWLIWVVAYLRIGLGRTALGPASVEIVPERGS